MTSFVSSLQCISQINRSNGDIYMNESKTPRWKSWLVLALAALSAPLAHATWPQKPVHVIVAAPAGGTADLVARVVTEEIGRSTGQPFIVDPKPGATGIVGAEALLAAPRDGYTAMVYIDALVTEAPFTYKMRFDPFKDLKVVASLAHTGLVLVTHPSIRAKTVPELLSHVKASPGKVNFASYGAGSIAHVLGMVLNKSAGLDMEHVAYRGSPPALLDLMAGRVEFMFDGLTTSVPYIKSGKLKPLIVTAPNRSALLPDVPTAAEIGRKDLEASVWFGLWMAEGVPQPVLQRIREEVLKALQAPAVRQKLMQAGLDLPLASTPDQLEKIMRADQERIGKILKSIDYKPQ